MLPKRTWKPAALIGFGCSSSTIKNMKQDFTAWRNQILQNSQNISPLKFGMSQDEIMEIFGKPDAISTIRNNGKPLILKYHDIELHFDKKVPHGLYFVHRGSIPKFV